MPRRSRERPARRAHRRGSATPTRPLRSRIARTLRDLAPDVAGLGTSCGAFLSLEKLLELERDARWETRYVVVADGDRTCGVLPVYLARHERWFDPDYDVSKLVEPNSRTARASDWILVGGRAEMAAGFLRELSGPARALAAAEAAGDSVRELAAERGCRIAAFYVNDDEKPFIRTALGPSCRELRLASEAWFHAAPGDDAAFCASLKSSHRGVVRRDWRERDRHGIETVVRDWEDVLDWAPALIHDVARRHGRPDHPRLIKDRLEQWLANGEIEPVAFCAEADGAPLAVCLGWRWRSILQLYKVGLVDTETPGRLAAYADAVFHAPRRFAADRGCHSIWAGFYASETKRLRGAEIRDVVALVPTESTAAS